MKIRKFLILSLFLMIGMLLFIPNKVNATTELNKINFIIEEPQEGENPNFKAQAIASNLDGTIEEGIGNVELEWYDYDDNPLEEDFIFETNTNYYSRVSEAGVRKLKDELTVKGYSLVENYKVFYNGIDTEGGNAVFYLGNGIKSQKWDIKLIEGRDFPSSFECTFISEEGEIRIFHPEIIRWFKLDGSGGQIVDSTSDLPIRDAIYTFHFDWGEESAEVKNFLYMCDIETKFFLNDIEQGASSELQVSPIYLYNLRYDSNTAVENSFTQSFIKGEMLQIKENIFENEGYIFKNWNTKADGTGDMFEENDTIELQLGEDFVLYAQWEKRKIEIIEFINTSKDQKITKGVDSSLNFYLHTNKDGWKVFIDDVEVEKSYSWGKVESLLMLELEKEILNNLSVGKHTIKVMIDNYTYGETTFTIIENEDLSTTGEKDEFQTDENEDSTQNNNDITENENVNNINNPQTEDQITTFIIILCIAILGIIITTKMKKIID